MFITLQACIRVCLCVQITGETVGEVKAVADMHQRKAEMARQSDAFIALPGTVIFFLTIKLSSEPTCRCSSLFTVAFSPWSCHTYILDPCVVEA